MDTLEKKEILKKAINLVDKEIKENENVVIKSKNGMMLQRHNLENNKLTDLKILLQEYLDLYSYKFLPILENENLNNVNIDDNIESLNMMLIISKKISKFKFRYFFYNINIYNIFENFQPSFPEFMEKINKEVIRIIYKLEQLKTNYDEKLEKGKSL